MTSIPSEDTELDATLMEAAVTAARANVRPESGTNNDIARPSWGKGHQKRGVKNKDSMHGSS